VAVSGIVTELESILQAVAPADRPYVPIVFFVFRIMVMLFAPIFGGIAFEFRFHARALRHGRDYAFAAGSVLEFVGAGLVVLRPVILAYLGHASWVFRGRVTADAEPRVKAKSGNLVS
jgi:cytochrome bd-type quinol oxidase subunit 2